MQAYIISDMDFSSELFKSLHKEITEYLGKKGFDIKEKSIASGDLHHCVGCFGCWIKKPGECVINDDMAQINRDYINSDVAVYLSPVVFGQYSANIKDAIDRWIPNALPFFKTRSDGSTMHPARYKRYPKLISIAYGDDLSHEDMTLFEDINKKHRENMDVLRYTNKEALIKDLDNIELKKVGNEL